MQGKNVLFFSTHSSKTCTGLAFGIRRHPLAEKPKPWRFSVILEITYGGWTLIRESVLLMFYKSKDIQFMTLVNLLDSYILLSLCIYSIVFKLNKTEMYINSIVRAWVIFLTFRRTHYNTNPLKWLSDYFYTGTSLRWNI